MAGIFSGARTYPSLRDRLYFNLKNAPAAGPENQIPGFGLRSCLRYAALSQSICEPDAFRVKHEDAIRKVVATIVSQGMAQPDARRKIEEYARQVPEGNQLRFIEVVETELLSLHAANLARYLIRPSEFARAGRRFGMIPAIDFPGAYRFEPIFLESGKIAILVKKRSNCWNFKRPY